MTSELRNVIVSKDIGNKYLTPTELNVLICSMKGLSIQQTATAVGITYESVKTHRSRCIKSLFAESHSITEAVSNAYRLGIFTVVK